MKNTWKISAVLLATVGILFFAMKTNASSAGSGETHAVGSNTKNAQQDREQEKDRQEKPKVEPKKKDRIVIPANDDNSVDRRIFMRQKLVASQFVLEGLTTNDFDLIDKGLTRINEITESESWVTIDDPKYKKLRAEFQEATDKLAAASKSKNIDAAAYRYFQLSAQCIDCHQHIRLAEYEF